MTERKSLPIPTNSKIKQQVNRRVRQRAPDALHTDIRSPQGIVHLPIIQPLDQLVPPVPRGGRPVDPHRPGVPVVVRYVNSPAAARGLVACPSGKLAAVDGAVARVEPVDALHDVDLAARRPSRPVAERVAQHPKGRPDPLLVLLRVVAEPDPRLHHRDPAPSGREGLSGLDPTGSPLARAGLARNELHGVAARELEVLVRGGVLLGLIVGVDAVVSGQSCIMACL